MTCLHRPTAFSAPLLTGTDAADDAAIELSPTLGDGRGQAAAA
jgi:hypothetical protein